MEFNNVSDQAILDENTFIKEDFKSTVNFRLGTEFTVPNTDISLRAGFAYLPSPYSFDSSPNAQKYITGGLGWIIDNAIQFDIGYAYGFWNTDDAVQHVITYSPQNLNVSVSTGEQIHTNTIIGTISYRF